MKKTLYYVILLISLLSHGVTTAQCFSSVIAGEYQTVGLKPDGTIWGWGFGGWGQLNNPDLMDAYSPSLLSSLNTWQMIRAGQITTFAVKNNGTLWGCGGNLYGVLGIGSTIDYVDSFVQIGSGSSWKSIAPADYFTIGIKTNGTLWGWGQNVYHQLGDGTVVQRNSPVLISSSTDWKTVASTRCDSSVAIKTDGTLWGWGSNSCYIFGGSDVSDYTIPQALTITTDTNWDKIAAGGAHFLVLKTNGTLWSWGSNGFGQVGYDPNIIHNYDLNQITGNWKAISAGYRFSMGIKTDGTLWQWGNNDISEVTNTPTNYSFIPIQIGTATNWESISCGDYFAVALRTDGSLWTWGNNYYGQLGNGSTTSTISPAQVSIAGCSLGTETFTTATHFTISPSPAQQELLVTYQGAQTVDAIVIYDISGKEVYRIAAMGNAAFSSSFSIASLSGGSYVMALINGGKTVLSKQFVKE